MEEAGSTEGLSLSAYLIEAFTSPVNIILIGFIIYFAYKLFWKKRTSSPTVRVELPPLKRQDMTPEELKKYDGTNSEGRVCLAVNGKIFDVTKGKRFYGPDGPYAAFAGRDATRGLATFSVSTSEGYDDLSDLNSMQMDSVKEWEMQFIERYHYVGRLLKPGEEATDYSEEEDNHADKETKKSD